MAWHVDFTPEAEAWFKGLPPGDRARMGHQVDKLRQGGPNLGRPAVDSVNGSQHHNMKELRAKGTTLRALFAFGPDRHALVLVGGDKAGQGNRWYRVQMKTADRLLDEHLKTFTRRSACRATRAGTKSAARQI